MNDRKLNRLCHCGISMLGAERIAPRQPSGSEKHRHGAGDYAPKLTVRTKSKNGQIFIEVQDNGPGIPDEIKDKILQPFFRTKKGIQGTGLGLSITNYIIKAHGWDIAIKSKKHEGTTFMFELHV
ncbi:MAG: HAMP domain-containing histidine kinase [Balneolaceae bacterium]|nr:HAMP domain-containing histidine kinase [Balneolaceae bacterium]